MTQRLSPFSLDDARPRLIMSIEGLQGCGKTHFALTAPKRLAWFNMDRGFEANDSAKRAALSLDAASVDVGVYTFDKADAGGTDVTAIAKACDTAAWSPFREDYAKAGEGGKYRSLVIDTATEAWEFCRLARFGKMEQIPPMLYAPVNSEFRGRILRAPFKWGCNVIFIHKIKDEYDSKVVNGKEVSVRTGKMKRAGFKEVEYALPILCSMHKDLTQPIPERYVLRVTKCAQNPDLEGCEFPGIDFPTFGTLVYPDSTPEDWQ